MHGHNTQTHSLTHTCKHRDTHIHADTETHAYGHIPTDMSTQSRFIQERPHTHIHTDTDIHKELPRHTQRHAPTSKLTNTKRHMKDTHERHTHTRKHSEGGYRNPPHSSNRRQKHINKHRNISKQKTSPVEEIYTLQKH